jgi:aspartate oxidase
MKRRRFERKRVLILGGGFAGLAAALELRPDRHEVILSSIAAAGSSSCPTSTSCSLV